MAALQEPHFLYWCLLHLVTRINCNIHPNTWPRSSTIIWQRSLRSRSFSATLRHANKDKDLQDYVFGQQNKDAKKWVFWYSRPARRIGFMQRTYSLYYIVLMKSGTKLRTTKWSWHLPCLTSQLSMPSWILGLNWTCPGVLERISRGQSAGMEANEQGPLAFASQRSMQKRRCLVRTQVDRCW